MSDELLIALERARGEQDIVLRLDVQATLLSPPEGVHARAEAQVSVRISRTRWLELLDQAGTEVGVLVRVRSPLTDPLLRSAANDEDAASLAQTTIRLVQARAELRDLQWEHCVGACRRVLEILGQLVDLPKPKVVFDVTPPLRTSEQRWAAIYYDVMNMTQPAHHDDSNATQFEWNSEFPLVAWRHPLRR